MIHDCPYCECLDDLPPRNLETHPLTDFERTLMDVYGPQVLQALAEPVALRRFAKGD